MMEIFLKIWSLLKLILDLLGIKIVSKDEYKSYKLEVKSDYPEQSTECIEEKKNGSKFRWSDKLPSTDYEKYFEIKSDKRIYFTNNGRTLWIKRKNNT